MNYNWHVPTFSTSDLTQGFYENKCFFYPFWTQKNPTWLDYERRDAGAGQINQMATFIFISQKVHEYRAK